MDDICPYMLMCVCVCMIELQPRQRINYIL